VNLASYADCAHNPITCFGDQHFAPAFLTFVPTVHNLARFDLRRKRIAQFCDIVLLSAPDYDFVSSFIRHGHLAADETKTTTKTIESVSLLISLPP
jgi:hypothetical protein